jgi:hypothetical protein
MMRALAVSIVVGTVPWVCGPRVLAQTPAIKLDVPAASGLPVSPIFEGWYQIGATKYALFGYYNRNLEEVVDVPIGPANRVSPGAIDQGQPTRFFPGQQDGVFVVAVPNDKTEVSWTLTSHGQTFSIPAFLHAEYLIAPQRNDAGTYPGNTPPTLKLEPSGPSAQGPLGITISRTATASKPLPLDVWVTDDGLPPAPGSGGPAPALRGAPGGRARQEGLNVTWRVYRGSGDVKFSDAAPAIKGGQAQTTATFSQPGDYMLHVVALDSKSGNRCCWTNGYVKVAVAAGSQNR